MSKYIDAGKLKYEIERRNLSEHYTAERYEEELYEIIDSLEDEQPIGELEEAVEGTVCKDESDVWIEIRPDALPNFKDMQPVKLIVKEDVE